MEGDGKNTFGKGLQWSFIEKISVIGLQIILEIIFARLLLPKDYGVLAIMMVVIAFASVFVDGGFSNALIHYRDRTIADYSTVFYFSLLIGLVCYIAIFFIAPYLSFYFKKDITLMLRILGLNVIFNSFGVYYRAKLSIDLSFKSQTIFSIIAILISGTIGIILASNAYGVWALVVQLLIYSFLYNLFLYINNPKIPEYSITNESKKRILGFGSKIFFSSLIQSIYFNSYPLVLGRLYHTNVVGLYSKANQLTTYPAGIFSTIFQRVFFPYMIRFQKDYGKVFEIVLRLVRWYAILALPILLIVLIFSDKLIVTVLSGNWSDLVDPFKILLVASFFFPIIILNMTVFQIIGKPNTFLLTEILTKVFGVVILLFTFKYGLIYVCLGILLQIFIQFFTTAYIIGLQLGNSRMQEFLFVIKLVLAHGLVFLGINYLQYLSIIDIYIVLAILGYLILYLLIIKQFYKEDYSALVDVVSQKLKRK